MNHPHVHIRSTSGGFATLPDVGWGRLSAFWPPCRVSAVKNSRLSLVLHL
jgi:hypothetical protein